jgi:hypothetical protein
MNKNRAKKHHPHGKAVLCIVFIEIRLIMTIFFA